MTEESGIERQKKRAREKKETGRRENGEEKAEITREDMLTDTEWSDGEGEWLY